MGGYGRGGGHYSKYTQQVSFREPGQTDNVKTVYPPTSTVCGGLITKSHNTKRTYGQPIERLFPLSNRNRTKVIQVDFFKKNPIERFAATTAADDADVSQ